MLRRDWLRLALDKGKFKRMVTVSKNAFKKKIKNVARDKVVTK